MKITMLIFGIIGSLIGLGGSLVTIFSGFGGAALGVLAENSGTADSGATVFWSGVTASLINFFVLIFSVSGGAGKSKNTIFVSALAVLFLGLLNIYLYNWVSGGLITVAGIFGLFGSKEGVENDSPITKYPFFYVVMFFVVILAAVSVFMKNMNEIGPKNDKSIGYKATETNNEKIEINYTENEKTTLLSDSSGDVISVIKTRYGDVVIREVNGNKGLFFNNSLIFQPDAVYPYLYIEDEKAYRVGNDDVLIVSIHTGGSGVGMLQNAFLSINSTQGKPRISEWVYPDGGTTQTENGIYIDLGHYDGFHHIFAYENGKVYTKKISDAGQPADDDICNYLYNDIYVNYVKKQACQERPEEVSGMASSRSYYILEKDQRLNLKTFQELAASSCVRSDLINYSQFKNLVCNGSQSTIGSGNTSQVQSPNDQKSVMLPPHAVGDTYVTESVNIIDGKSINMTERKVVLVGNDRIVVESKSLSSKKGTVRTLEFTPEWNLISSKNPDGGQLSYSPPLKYFEFPLYEGKQWQESSIETNSKTGANRKYTISTKVYDWETVATPAGSFIALKLVSETEVFDQTSGATTRGTDTSWYVPEIRKSVKSEITSMKQDGSEDKQVIQLVGYKIAN